MDPVKVSEPKMPEPEWDGGLMYSHAEMVSHHAAWQAYAAGIRAAVLAEVRAVVPEESMPDFAIKNSRLHAAGYNDARDDFLYALTTLEQQP